MVSERYKKRLMKWLFDFKDGRSTVELRKEFPNAPLQQMEMANQIQYINEKWFCVHKGE